MSTIDQQFIEFVVKSLVGNPDAVVVDRRVDEKGVLLELTVDPEDLGRVIGKRGATAQSLRTLLRALGTKNEARYNLKIVDNGVGGHAHQDSDSDDKPTKKSDKPAISNDDSTASAAPIADTDDEVTDYSSSNANESDRLAQTRKELAELDDLDV